MKLGELKLKVLMKDRMFRELFGHKDTLQSVNMAVLREYFLTWRKLTPVELVRH